MATDYIVFQEVTNHDFPGDTAIWQELATVAAPSASAAVRKTVGGGGNYVAVPKRSFQPVVVEVETPQPRVRIVT